LDDGLRCASPIPQGLNPDMLPANLLNTIKALALAQKPLPPTAGETSPKAGQFEVGKKLEASVQAQVSPGVFKVRIADQLIQMQLPSSVRSGDTITLQVIANQPRLTFSMVNSANPLSTPEQLGSAARLLSSLSQQAPEKAYVRAAQSAPIWEKTQPPESKQLSGLLREALSNSGLFYESHQAQWLEGTRSTAQLLHEPQNLTPEQAKAVIAGNAAGKALMKGDSSGKAAMASDTSGKIALANDSSGKAAMASETSGKNAMANDTSGKAAMMSDTYGKAAMASETSGKNAMASDTSGKAAMMSDTYGKTAMMSNTSGKIAIADDSSGKTAMASETSGKAAIMTSDTSGKIAMASDTSGKTAMASETSGKNAMANDTSGKAAMASETSGKNAMANDTSGKAAMVSDTYGKTAMMGDTANPSVTTSNTANANVSNQPNTTLLQEGKALGIPDHLQPLVQQQLNALETRQMVWQGNVWPEQSMQWEVHEQPSPTPDAEAQRQWVTQLRLDLPSLGEVAATLRFNNAGLSLTLNAGTPETLALLGKASTQLVAALSDAGIPVLSTQVTTT